MGWCEEGQSGEMARRWPREAIPVASGGGGGAFGYQEVAKGRCFSGSGAQGWVEQGGMPSGVGMAGGDQ